MPIFEAWKKHDGTQVTFSTPENIADQRCKGLMPGKWRLMHRIEAADFDAAMTTHYELLGYPPYKPMKDK
jgi:hypothetical protein